MADRLARFDFAALVAAIRQVDDHLAAQAGRAVNISLTMRNWLMGDYISEYELRGADRATYWESLLTELAQDLTDHAISNCNRCQLYRYLRFYRLYPEIVGTLSPQLNSLLPTALPGRQTASHAFAGMDSHLFVSKYQHELPIREDIQRSLEEKKRKDLGYGG